MRTPAGILQTGFCWDTFLSIPLPAGSYQLVLTQSANVANGPTLTASFAYAGQGNFTRGPESTGTGGFWDSTGVQLGSFYSLAVQGADNAFAQLAITQTAPPTGKVAAGYSLQFAASGGTQPYTWSTVNGTIPPGTTLSAAGLLSGSPAASGTYNFTVLVSDLGNPQMTASQSVQIAVAPQDLQITTSSLQNWVVSNAFSKQLTALGGYPPWSWSLVSEASTAGLSVTPGGVLSGTPPVAGSFTIPVQVTDSQSNSVRQQLNWQVNPPVQITSAAGLPPGVTGRVYMPFTLNATGGATAGYTWSITSGAAPPGVSFSAAGVLQGTTNTRGTYTFTVQASDAIQPAQKGVTLAVYDPLLITTTALPGGTAQSAYASFSLAASGGSGSYLWSSPNLPFGLTLSAAGQISGTPLFGGTSPATINLMDTTAGQIASVALTIAISYPALSISATSTTISAALGAPISRTFSASGGKPPYTWTATGQPQSVSVDPGSGTLSGIASQAGNFALSIEVTDAQQVSTSVSTTLEVLGITTTSLPSASTTAAYSQSFAAAGGTSPYSFSARGIPAGLSLSGSGLLSGVAKTTGNYTLTVQVADSSGISASSVLNLTVNAPANFAVSGASLSNGTAGTPYSDALAAKRRHSSLRVDHCRGDASRWLDFRRFRLHFGHACQSRNLFLHSPGYGCLRAHGCGSVDDYYRASTSDIPRRNLNPAGYCRFGLSCVASGAFRGDSPLYACRFRRIAPGWPESFKRTDLRNPECQRHIRFHRAGE